MDRSTSASSGESADETDASGERTRVETPRSTHGREWEVFLGEDGPPRHVGSVSAPTEEAAREQAVQLFDRWAGDLWLCPADEVRRFATDSLTA